MNLHSKETQLPPICDGSHKKIEERNETESDNSKLVLTDKI